MHIHMMSIALAANTRCSLYKLRRTYGSAIIYIAAYVPQLGDLSFIYLFVLYIRVYTYGLELASELVHVRSIRRHVVWIVAIYREKCLYWSKNANN